MDVKDRAVIVIHAKGDSKIGIGNLSRSFELFKFLKKFNENVVCVFECNEEVFARYDCSGVIRSNSRKDSLSVLSGFKIELYICDLVDAGAELSDKLRELGVRKIAHFNGLEGGFKPDALFITDGFDYAAPKGNFKVYRGFEYYVVPELIVDKRLLKPKNLNSIKKVLVSFGGADPAFYTEYFVNSISSDDGRFYTVVLGPAMELSRKKVIKSIVKPNIIYIDSPIGLGDLLLESDLLITLGGMSTYEAMCLGVPVAAIRWSYLSYIVQSFGKLGMISDLGDFAGSYERSLALDVKNVNEICKNAYNIIDGKALLNIKDAIYEIRGA